MSFNPAIPTIGDFIAISQKQILANFIAIDRTWLIDHVALTAVADVGKHISLTLRPVSDPATASNQSAIYNKLDGSSVPQLFFRPNSNATPIQLSNSNLNTMQTGAAGGNQVSFLAGPFTIYFGFIVSASPIEPVALTPSTTLKYVGVSTILPKPQPSGPNTKQGYNVAIATDVVGNTFNIRRQIFTFPTIVYYMAIGL